jgi:hypothetical protein
MVEVDYVVPGIVVEKDGIVNVSEMYKVLKEWFEKRNYAVIEKDFSDESDVDRSDSENPKEKKKIAIKWKCEKEVDDYTRFVIEINLKGNVNEVLLKNKKAYKGIITVKFESYMEQDYEDRFENSPLFKITRGIYDKFALKKRFSEYSKKLKDETYDVYYETKAYLGLLNLE